MAGMEVSRRQVVLGRRVLFVSVLAAIIGIACSVVALLVVTGPDEIFAFGRPEIVGRQVAGVLLALLVPACGCIAAKTFSLTLTCCFSCLNFAGAICILLAAAVVALVLASMEDAQCYSYPTSRLCPTSKLLDAWCSHSSDYGYSEQGCQDDMTAQMPAMHSLVIVLLSQLLAFFCLQCLGWWWGLQLYNDLTAKPCVSVAAFSVETVATAPQPSPIGAGPRPGFET